MLRSPSLGATQALLDECRRHNEVITPVQQRELYNSLKSKMLRVLISCSGAKTINELLDMLELELKSGILLLLFPIGTNFPQSNGVPEKWTTINVAIGIALIRKSMTRPALHAVPDANWLIIAARNVRSKIGRTGTGKFVKKI